MELPHKDASVMVMKAVLNEVIFLWLVLGKEVPADGQCLPAAVFTVLAGVLYAKGAGRASPDETRNLGTSAAAALFRSRSLYCSSSLSKVATCSFNLCFMGTRNVKSLALDLSCLHWFESR